MIDISGHLRSYRQECGFDDLKNYITVNCCGFQKFTTKNFTRHREKGRLDYQLLYIVKGKGFFKLEGNLTTVNEGNIIIYSPNEEQLYTYYFEDSPEVYWVHFTGYGANECLEKSGLVNGQLFYMGLSNTCIESFKKIINELQIKKPMYDSISNAIFLELLALIGRRKLELAGDTNRIKDKNLQKIIEKIHSSYNLKWSVKDFARECNLSVYRFIHVFKNHSGLSPLEYLTKVRIDKAKELLLDSSLNISEISNIIGYDNPLYFSRIFKKTAGMPPSQFRNSPQR
jgi:AraC family transcriptional regulator, arabinose operon regulatory protein